ncbi:cytochrome P450 CYP82D47-like [Populus trichocarpa]|uniref:cytochrome P450 CYP82D47-like n=1 Tax=Populus trichocarpa TaxID=3694 RepID=UPI0022785E24|nr:cytochrome P450 CYP82D47-like [Populus trichocarpa]
MDFPFQFSATAVLILFAFITPSIYYLFRIPGKENKKRAPPEAAGAWPLIGHLHLLGGSQPPHITLGNLADKYGPIFTVKLEVHRTLIVSNWEMAKECLRTNDKAFATRPKTLAMDILGYNYSMLGFSPYGTYWRLIRKIVTLEVLSNHRLEMFTHVREDEVRDAIGALYQQWIGNKSNSQKLLLVEMKRWFSDITLNVILKIIVSKRYVDYVSRGEEKPSHEWGDSIRTFLELAGMFVVSDALPFLRWLDLGGVEKAMKRTSKNIDRAVEKWLEEHKQKKASGTAKGEEDFMDLMLSVLDDGKELSNRSADTINKATCLTLVLAAADTTSVTLTWTLSLLLNNREVLKKAQDELDIHVGRERQVKESDMKNLVYLQAIIKETFRLYPAAPLSVPHESMEECTVGGYQIPAGTRLFTNLSKIHRDPQVWSDPDEFQPERFLTTHKDCDFRGQHFELIPFGSGRRMCPGVSFALQVVNLALATLLHGFDIETLDDAPIDMTETGGITNIKATPLEALLTPRLSPGLYDLQ